MAFASICEALKDSRQIQAQTLVQRFNKGCTVQSERTEMVWHDKVITHMNKTTQGGSGETGYK